MKLRRQKIFLLSSFCFDSKRFELRLRRRPARLALKATGPLAQTAAKEAQNVAQCVAQKEGYLMAGLCTLFKDLTL